MRTQMTSTTLLQQRTLTSTSGRKTTITAKAMAAFVGIALLWATPAKAYLTVTDTAEILPANSYALGVVPQLVTSDNTGFNAGAYVDAPINNASQARISLGTGVTDFWTGISYKYIPFPDVGNQPAIGVKGDLTYGRDGEVNYMNYQLAPLISKKKVISHGLLIPYVSVPLTYQTSKIKNFVASQFVIGSEFIAKANSDYHFGGEIGFNLNQSFSYIAAYVAFPFDKSLGFRR